MDINELVGSCQSIIGNLVFQYSDDFQKYLSAGGRCPSCKEKLWNSMGVHTKVEYYFADGTRASNLHSVDPTLSHARCSICGYQWNVRPNTTIEQPKQVKVLSVTETSRSQENIGDDKRIIDNLKSPAILRRKFTVSKNWKRSYTIEYEAVQVDGHEFSLGIQGTGLKFLTEESLRRQYSISENSQETYTEEVEIEVPAFTRLAVIFHWKRILQNGSIRITNNQGQEFDIPFHIVAGLTFDQLQYEDRE
ncbi:hypothetical protein PMG71_03710 [Roseofilum sp. BLCC_M154]|uniref:Uncharacterized protein n=1 Tax=Roseofilum acuticapitatum BLCC-M154 TaxID=3022444 RepID=A0ABT7ANR8_9CYAN|nr:hypothetical protein [Roseofilum acuticapitatum]MDJ1168530.1 hypothetical protein [Roseofilum acuticapitatum BLCC-M154]